MERYIVFAGALLLAGLLSGCGVAQNDSPGNAEARKVIIDMDTAGDDASALILAAKSSSLDILGVTGP